VVESDRGRAGKSKSRLRWINYASEVETVLYMHPAVRLVAVVGVPDAYHGEIVRACVVLKEGMSVTDLDLIAHCKTGLAPYKIPRQVELRDNLPMVEIDKDHVFEGPNGKASLIDLFEGRRQLLVYHFWFQPGEEPCEGCSLWTYDLGDLGGDFASLRKYDTTLAFVSRASSAELEGLKKRRHWTMPWYSIVGDDFDDATGYAGWAQISIFARDGHAAYLANVIPFDDLKNVGNHWSLLERTPFDVGN
jgi:hypothetical protein